jgi:hypothetical protein
MRHLQFQSPNYFFKLPHQLLPEAAFVAVITDTMRTGGIVDYLAAILSGRGRPLR